MNNTAPNMLGKDDWPALLSFMMLAICSGVMSWVQSWTSETIKTYAESRKPGIAPARHMGYSAVWLCVAAMDGAAAFLAWQNGHQPTGAIYTAALALWLVQIGLKTLWAPTFFGAQRPQLALGIMGLLVCTAVADIVLLGLVRPLAAGLAVLNVVWLVFATFLNMWTVRHSGLLQEEDDEGHT